MKKSLNSGSGDSHQTLRDAVYFETVYDNSVFSELFVDTGCGQWASGCGLVNLFRMRAVS